MEQSVAETADRNDAAVYIQEGVLSDISNGDKGPYIYPTTYEQPGYSNWVEWPHQQYTTEPIHAITSYGCQPTPITSIEPIAPPSRRGRPRGSSTIVDENGKPVPTVGDKIEQRRQRNRIAAIQSRMRRKEYIRRLETRQHEQGHLIEQLQEEVRYLRMLQGIPLDLPLQTSLNQNADYAEYIQQTYGSNGPAASETVVEENQKNNDLQDSEVVAKKETD
ncbi:unnamed protein product [Dimorphilus gyrociliatus]|uniref:BZIP domain-containing protein n=1 Tax=Dimorphilus gyrociliatus TaxID=2664684 RepID=A0A7I8W521_9ANNE|nr:unnamed protein product [Dimorphilus gyrociliatus]